MTSGACHKTSPLFTTPSALHTKSKVCKTALSVGWSIIQIVQLTGSWGLQLKLKPAKARNKKQQWGFGGGWNPAASPLNLQLGSGPVQLTLITIVKKTLHKLLKNIRTSVLKTHSHITHTYLGCLPHLLLLWFFHLIRKYWTDIWTFLFSIHRDPLNFLLSLSSSFPSFLFFFLLAHLLWVGSAHALLVSDPLADEILRCLRGGRWPCYGNFTVPSTRNEFSFFGDLDAGSR